MKSRSAYSRARKSSPNMEVDFPLFIGPK